MKISNSGTFTAVGWDGEQWIIVWQDGESLVIATRARDLNIGSQQTFPLGPDAGSFPKVGKFEEGGGGLVAFRYGAPSYLIAIRNISFPSDISPTPGTERFYGKGFGNDPVVLAGPCPYYQGTPDYKILRWDGSWPGQFGAPTGLSRYAPNGRPYPNEILTIDEDRIYNGYTRPGFAPHAVAVEGHVTGNVIFRDDGKVAIAFDGEEAFSPSLAFNGTDYLIGTWGREGVRIQLLTPADFHTPVSDPPPVDPPPVNPPPSDPPPLHPPMALTPQQILASAQRWPWDFDVQFMEVFRQGVWKRDQGSDLPSKGALAYYHKAVATSFVQRCIELNHDLLSPDDWGKVFERGAQQALVNYKREQGPGPEDPQ